MKSKTFRHSSNKTCKRKALSGIIQTQTSANHLAYIYPRGNLDSFHNVSKLYINYISTMVRSAAQKSTAHKRGASSDHVARGKRAKQLDDSLDELLGEEGSEFEDADSTTPSADEDEDSDDFDDRKTPRSRRISKAYGKKSETGSGSRKKSAPNKLSAKDLSKPGVKTGLGPGTQVVIKRPKARDPGDTPYSDEIIHPNTMLFLEDLAANNNRQWLKSELSSFYPTFATRFGQNLSFKDLNCSISRCAWLKLGGKMEVHGLLPLIPNADELPASSCGVCIIGTNISCRIRMNPLTDSPCSA